MPEGTDNIAGLNSGLPTDPGAAGEGAAELRQLKAVLKNCFGGVDGPIYNAAGEKPTADEWTALFEAIDSLTSGGSGGGSSGYFVGQICAYYGLTTDIPTGWVLCDGRNGTPNLVGRFPLGWNDLATTPSYDGQTSGGSDPENWTTGPAGSHAHTVLINDHVLTQANLPAHRHQMFGTEVKTMADTTVGANETVAAEVTGGADENQRYQMEAVLTTPTAVEATVGLTGKGGLNDTPTALSHTTAVSNTVADHTHSLLGASFPPWRAVFWIMYIGVSDA